MSSDQQAVITLINRSMVLIRELNDTRRVNRDLEQRLSEYKHRIMVLEAQLAAQPETHAAEASSLRAA